VVDPARPLDFWLMVGPPIRRGELAAVPVVERRG
jgi:hypothetical protein